MGLRLTITLFAQEATDGPRVVIGLPHTVGFPDASRLHDFARRIGLDHEVIRILNEPLVDTLLIGRDRLWWAYAPSEAGPEHDTITRDGGMPFPLRDLGLSSADSQTLRSLRRLVPIVGEHATLSITAEPTLGAET